jgi:hypothetical protein
MKLIFCELLWASSRVKLLILTESSCSNSHPKYEEIVLEAYIEVKKTRAAVYKNY